MEETNFYSYMNAAAKAIAFDEIAEAVDLNSEESIQKAFESYIEDNPPPYDIKEALLDERFYLSSSENGTESIQFSGTIPGVTASIDRENLQTYFEDFLEKIGAESNKTTIVEVDVSDDERGGALVEVYIALVGQKEKPQEQKGDKP